MQPFFFAAVSLATLASSFQEGVELAKVSSEELSIRMAPQEEGKFFVLMSFAVPNEVWVSLSRDLSRVGGEFVVRGFPNDRFEDFVSRIKKLERAGVSAPIVLDPERFSRFEKQEVVPCFVLESSGRYDKLYGAVTVDFVLSKMEEAGENADIAKKLRGLIRG